MRRPHRLPVLAAPAVTAAAAFTHASAMLYLACLSALLILILLIFIGVVLPAVWSRKHSRRAAAAAVLDQILTVPRSLRSP